MSKQTIFRQGSLKCRTGQDAYILILSIILLLAMLMASLNFFEQSVDSNKISGYSRDSAESLLFAESAMNWVYGRYVFNQDVDGDGIIETSLKLNIDNPTTLPLTYSYFITAGNGIDQALPSLLQRVANGEARKNGSAGDGNTFSVNQNELLIENLYTTNNIKPLVFEFNTQNQLIISNKNWTTLTSTEAKAAAVWFELVRNPELAGTIQIYVEAVAKTGNSKSYVQRLIGNFQDTLGADLITLGESMHQSN